MKVILASQSPYRRALLEAYGLAITCISPLADEEVLKNELLRVSTPPQEIGLRLAEAKALSVLETQSTNCVVIGGDQLCVFKDEILNKPGTFLKNVEHLRKLQGQSHQLITCVCIASSTHKVTFADITTLTMKALTDEEIKDYVTKDQPMDCAGGYRYELDGHLLFESVVSQDLTAIQGLPLQQTLETLRSEFQLHI
ncbi:MAG: Maf family protein [Bdellovibrionaceae bacterium]|nr:Maf family protein [Pseudobdellovibrionaceae bacterium]